MDMENDKVPCCIQDALPHVKKNVCTAVQTKLGDITFCASSYMEEIIEIMDCMRNNKMLTDVILEVGSEMFHAHKVVLAAASPYFKAMFTGRLIESNLLKVKIQEVSEIAVADILHFMYSGKILLTENNVCKILEAATMFQIPYLIEACCKFLENQLDFSNAIGIANFAEQYGCMELYQKVNQFIEKYFSQICQEDEFLQLSSVQLVTLIGKDKLNVLEEKEVYLAVLKWVKYDEINRSTKLKDILQVVCCHNLTPRFLKDQIRNCEVLKKLPVCQEYLAKILQDLALHKKHDVKIRTPKTMRNIYIAGGYSKRSLDIFEKYDTDDKIWVKLANLKQPVSGLGGALLKGNFYTVGGQNISLNESFDSNFLNRYDPVTNSWISCAPMKIARNRVGVAVIDEFLYAVGGSQGLEFHNSVERYDSDEDRWSMIKPMKNKRQGLGVAVVNRILYALGGYDGQKRLNSCESYHPENDEWNYIRAMNVARSGVGVAALNQYIYVVGGYDGKNQLKIVERYDTENDIWEYVAPLKVARSALSVNVVDGKLHALGGYDGVSFLSIVEVYDFATDVWKESVPLTKGRSGHVSAVSYDHYVPNNK